MGDETFTKVEFLNVFNGFRQQAFKRTTIESAWKKAGLIPYNPSIVLDKVREMLPPPRQATAPAQPFQPLAETPRTVRQIAEAGAELWMHPDLLEDLQRSVMRFAKGACASTRKGELMEE